MGENEERGKRNQPQMTYAMYLKMSKIEREYTRN